ncbi:MAG: polysaccharide deacetylase [Alphaproteobacteria bacterium]|nr:polysaccharide deacetylase [Alphaproteobacteria bacterium]
MSEAPRRAEPGLYDFVPPPKRPRITWPNGARLAFWVAPNIEFYELDPPPNAARNMWTRPNPDAMNYGWREFGNRVGVWRMIDVMAALGIRGSVSLNVAICDHHPEIVRRCLDLGWELFSHGVYNTRFVANMSEEQERAMIRDVVDTIRRASGQQVEGWLSPALYNNDRTMDLLAEHGIRYTCDLFHDDQPTPVRTKTGRMCSIPYSLEMNDILVYARQMQTPREYGRMIKAQFDQLYEEGAESGTVMCVPLHPYMVGQAHRLEPFAEALDYVARHDKVWLATGAEIARWYLDRHFDAAVAAARAPGG